jgi:ADP-ribose pyrophosphatase YjhB (NUDIX family)
MSLLGVNIAIMQRDRILLTKREDFAVWCLPGGAVESGESLAQAAIREAREETGLQVRLTGLVGVYSRPNWRAGGAHEVLFAAERIGGRLLTATAETTEAGWFGPNELPEPMFTWHYQRISDALNARRAIARTQNAAWPAGIGIATRQELYEMRDQDRLPMQTLMDTFCSRPRPEDDQLEVG